MITDLEYSTFQRRPCYRYIRASDKLPTCNYGATDPVATIKLFNPTGIGTWYITEYDPTTRTAYGLAVLQEAEFGYVSMEELVAYRGLYGLPIERDLHWTPRPLSEILAYERSLTA
jgi:hypothetical protein